MPWMKITIVFLLVAAVAPAQMVERDLTCFQTASPWSPELDMGSDVAVVYGMGGTFLDRLAGWRDQGYATSMMTGISWGGYEDYYVVGDTFKKEEVQTGKTGRLWMHGNSKTVGYNVPSPAYVDYIKEKINPAIDAGVQAVYLEEPEFWADTGWSAAFKEEWQRFYGEPWQAPDSSVDAQYRASKLKYELYFNALKEVVGHIKTRGKEKGFDIECHVPTHTVINYAHWRIVSPESRLMELEGMDGYIAQVWTGTARTHNRYRGVKKSRTFETAYLEYAQALGMVRPTGRKVWFLADPIEDNPNYSWNDYKRNYECTVVASLMWPEVSRFEVMPWPSRIFRGTYPKVDLDTASGDREGIPAEYATEILTIINALNDMDQTDVKRSMGTPGIGVLVSDSMMFQRARPHPSDSELGSFYALALPLLKNGVPVEVVQLENALHPNTLSPYKILLLTYEGQKPLDPKYHDALTAWVRQGGCLLYVGDGSDPYHRVREWWNEQGETNAKAQDDLFKRLGVSRTAYNEAEAVGAGWVRVFTEKPRALQRYDYGAKKIRELVNELLAKRGEALATQNNLVLQRGPYVIAACLDESVNEEPLVLQGRYIDLLDPKLAYQTEKTLQPDQRALLYDLDWAKNSDRPNRVVAAAARVKDERIENGALKFTARGPVATTARIRITLDKAATATLQGDTPLQQSWDAPSKTLLLEFPNQGKDILIEVKVP
jgi:hypothetical protein